MLVERYSSDMMDKALAGVFWGMGTDPRQFEKVTWNIYQAKSRPMGLSVPMFKIEFGMGESDNEVVLMWIEEVARIEEIGNP